ncbi:MAG: hypothetical protein R6X16_11790 [Anaerolineae bacterium]
MPERAANQPEGNVPAVRSPMEATRHGLPFGNRYAWESRARRIGPFRWAAKRISYGLCGGMCYAALDYFHAGLPVPSLYYPPVWGSPLHRYLLRRQIDSWRYLWVPLRTLWWMAATDRAVTRTTVRRELPRLLRKLDLGEPAVIVLVRVRRGDPTLNHQVVVTGYEREVNAGRVRLALYDPNHHGVQVTLSLNADRESESLNAVQSTGEPVRGFFLLPYRPRRRGLPQVFESI